jgi:hypothetical protein
VFVYGRDMRIEAPTTAAAIHEIASIAGTGRSQVWTAAKLLRDAGLWPVGTPGRSKSPRRPEASHLGNLVVALAITQNDVAEVAADRVWAFRMLVQVEGDRPGLAFGAALNEMIDLAACDSKFRAALLTHPGAAIQLTPTQMAGALITIGPSAGRYAATDLDVVQVALRMHVRSFGLSSISLINPGFIRILGEMLANFRAAQIALESESGTSQLKAAPPS